MSEPQQCLRLIKRFEFGNQTVSVMEEASELSESHAMHVWPSAIVMCCYMQQLLLHEESETVCELGCGCALPGILCAKLGYRAILTDHPLPDEAAWKLKMMSQCSLNQVRPSFDVLEQSSSESEEDIGDRAVILPLTWGQFDMNLIRLSKERIRYVIGSDCFYDPVLFEPLIVTVAYLLKEQAKRNNECEFISTYHERVDSYSIQHLLQKWGLKARIVPTCDYISPDIYQKIYHQPSDNHDSNHEKSTSHDEKFSPNTNNNDQLIQTKYQEAINNIRIIIISQVAP